MNVFGLFGVDVKPAERDVNVVLSEFDVLSSLLVWNSRAIIWRKEIAWWRADQSESGSGNGEEDEDWCG